MPTAWAAPSVAVRVRVTVPWSPHVSLQRSSHAPHSPTTQSTGQAWALHSCVSSVVSVQAAPPPEVLVAALSESSVDLVLRCW